jgi:hypothetical protein
MLTTTPLYCDFPSDATRLLVFLELIFLDDFFDDKLLFAFDFFVLLGSLANAGLLTATANANNKTNLRKIKLILFSSL